MALGDIHGIAIWPGVQTFLDATITIGHGITPGVCIFQMAEQDTLPLEYGDLVITDGNEIVKFPDCKVRRIRVEFDDEGRWWILEIEDRRWRWRDYGGINGCYNQMTPFGRLIPWTIRSPKELAKLCLAAMGEQNYDISNMPDGINYPGPEYPNPVINVSGVNPPVDWNGIPPGVALAELCDRCGCRIIYRWKTNDILITPVGSGAALPDGSIAKDLPTLTTPLAPSAVGVIGANTRYQVRLGVTAVGKEWDESVWPINLLSYAPVITTQATNQVTTITFKNFAGSGVTSVKLTLTDPQGEPHTIGFSPGVSDAATATAAVAAIDGAATDSQWSQVSAVAVSNVVTVTANAANTPFDLTADYFVDPVPDLAPEIEVETIQAPQPQKSRVSWENCYPPEFQGVRATDRLTVEDARRLAAESVWKWYQLTGVDVSGKGPPNIPGYGRVKRTMQIVLQDTQVDQITPQPQTNKIVLSNPIVMPPDAKNNKDVQTPLTVNFYNGYSRDKPAAVYGQIARTIVSDLVLFLDADGNPIKDVNTPAGSQVFVPFTVNPDFFMIQFSAPVFATNEQGLLKIPNLVLQTAVLVRDPQNNQTVHFTRVRPIVGGDPKTPTLFRHYEDVQLNVTSTYDINNNLLNYSVFEQDPIIRADYYLDGMVNEIQYKPGETVEFNNVRAIDLDGLTWQITWEVRGECYTVVTQNGEHSIWIPPYRARRRAEFLPPITALDRNGNRVNMGAPKGADVITVTTPSNFVATTS